jgi:hypothetical protein
MAATCARSTGLTVVQRSECGFRSLMSSPASKGMAQAKMHVYKLVE